MLTKEQAMTVDRVHSNGCQTTGKPQIWRRNGATQTWVTRPKDFRLPVKYGMYSYDAITPSNADSVHAPEDCPLQAKRS